MTTALVAKFAPKCSVIPPGFSRGDQGTWVLWNYHTSGYGFDFVLTTGIGDTLFPEDFPHKRAYLEAVKKTKAKAGPYRLERELLALFDSLNVEIIYFWVGMVDDFPGFDQPKQIQDIKWPITTRTLFEMDECYQTRKPVLARALPTQKAEKKSSKCNSDCRSKSKYR